MHGGVRGRGSNPPTYSIVHKNSGFVFVKNGNEILPNEKLPLSRIYFLSDGGFAFSQKAEEST